MPGVADRDVERVDRGQHLVDRGPVGHVHLPVGRGSRRRATRSSCPRPRPLRPGRSASRAHRARPARSAIAEPRSPAAPVTATPSPARSVPDVVIGSRHGLPPRARHAPAAASRASSDQRRPWAAPRRPSRAAGERTRPAFRSQSSLPVRLATSRTITVRGRSRSSRPERVVVEASSGCSRCRPSNVLPGDPDQRERGREWDHEVQQPR